MDQTEDERKLAAHVRKKVEEIRSSASRIAHEGIWMTNVAYLLGYDGMTYNTTTRSFQPINRASTYIKKNRIHVNKILPTIQNRLARLAKNPPKYDVRPESNSSDDKDQARLSLQILMAYWERLHLNEKRLTLLMMVQQFGHAYVKICWDDQMGEPMVDPLTNELDYEGDIRADIVSPLEIFPDPAAVSFEEVKRSWLIHAKVRKLDYFKTHYPEKGELVKEEDAWLLSSQYEQRINSMNTRGPSAGNQQLKDSAIELVKYESRSKDYPNGRMIVTANGILLADKELPTGEIPFAKFDDVIVGGKYYSESTITHLRPIQDQYNETIRRRAEWTKKLLAGKYMAPRGSGIAQEALNDESGEVFYYDQVPNSAGVQALQVPVIPQYAYIEEERLNEMFNDISGISEVSRGTLPSASIPAIGMQLLVEQDDSRIGVMTEQHEHAWALIGNLVLKFFKEFITMPRKLKFAGKGLEYTVKKVSGEDIGDNTDAIVIRGSTLPGSKALRRQEIINAYSQGFLGDPQDPKVREKVLGMLEFGDTSEIWEDYGLDSDQISRGIKELETGVLPPIDEQDNHPMWILEINRYRKQEKFLNLPPEIQQVFLQFREMHLQMALKLTNAPQMPPPQAPGDPGAPPPGGPMDPGMAPQPTDPSIPAGPNLAPPMAGGPPQ